MYLDPCDEYREKCAALAEEEKAKYYKPPERDTRQEEAHRGQGTTGADIGQEEPGETNPFPSHIMTGAAGHFSAVLAQVMESPRHFFFMVYLACIGIVMANKISLATELKPQPRLYLVLLGESADDRKSTAISKTVDFFISALTEFNVCFGVGSAEGLQKILDKKKSLLLVYDELKAFVGKAKADGSILLPATCTLFESNRFENHTKDKELKIMDAYLSIVAASTIATYERCWDSSFQDIGMTNCHHRFNSRAVAAG